MSKSKKAVSDDYLVRPVLTADELHHWVAYYTDLRIPRRKVCRGHQAPFDYLCKSYFEPSADLVVWAPRGGGKTRLAAVATLLDLLHKPGCSARILGGSLQQSLRIWEHLLPDLHQHARDRIVKAPDPSRRIKLCNESSAAALTQSQRAVRGMHVQKLRCDEVELFQPEIWEAAQMGIKSKAIDYRLSEKMLRGKGERMNEPKGPMPIPDSAPRLMAGAVEAISTHHKRGGLMGKIIDQAMELQKPVIKWCIMEVLEKCPQERECLKCPLFEDCGGVAKDDCHGFFRIDDAIAIKRRVSLESWQTEMLCHRPSTRNSVFPNFDRSAHVKTEVPLQNSHGLPSVGFGSGDSLTLAMDFGFHNPFVCLWIADDGVNCHVIDEYVQSGRVMDDHIREIESRRWGRLKHVCCDPAGNARNDQTAESNVRLLRRAGYRVHSRSSRIVDGVEMIRAALRPAAGDPKLFIHPRCERLIKALENLRYPEGGGELPLKDGEYDHPVDALRYYYVNRGSLRRAGSRAY